MPAPYPGAIMWSPPVPPTPNPTPVPQPDDDNTKLPDGTEGSINEWNIYIGLLLVTLILMAASIIYIVVKKYRRTVRLPSYSNWEQNQRLDQSGRLHLPEGAFVSASFAESTGNDSRRAKSHVHNSFKNTRFPTSGSINV